MAWIDACRPRYGGDGGATHVVEAQLLELAEHAGRSPAVLPAQLHDRLAGLLGRSGRPGSLTEGFLLMRTGSALHLQNVR